jgi:hypothetical protein
MDVKKQRIQMTIPTGKDKYNTIVFSGATPPNNQDDNPQSNKRDLQDQAISEVYSQIASAPSVHSQNPQSTQKSERVMIARAQGTNGNQNSEVKPIPPKLEERSQETGPTVDPRRLFEDEEFRDVFFRNKRLNIK